MGWKRITANKNKNPHLLANNSKVNINVDFIIESTNPNKMISREGFQFIQILPQIKKRNIQATTQ